MAVRSIDAINNRSKQIMEEKKNIADARMARVNRAMGIIMGLNDDIVDAVDTVVYMRRQGLGDCIESLVPSCGKKNTVYVTYTGNKVHLGFYCYGHETTRSTDQHYIDYYPDTKKFHCWSRLSWGGFDGWDPHTGKYHDEFFLPLIEEFASKVGPWCQAVFEAAENI